MKANKPVAKPPRNPRRWYGILLLATGVLLTQPIRTTSLRAALIASLVSLWMGALVLVRKQVPVRIALLLLVLLPLSVALLPDRPVDSPALRRAYLVSLRRYRGVHYVWGGETHMGIDCSGLVRAGLIDAEVREGLRTANPTLLRRALALWWNDCSAKALGDEYQGRTHLQASVSSLNDADYQTLQPGDIAVTDSGLHTLAYLGDTTWIEADPLSARVITCPIPNPEVYFSMEAKILRWRDLEPQ